MKTKTTKAVNPTTPRKPLTDEEAKILHDLMAQAHEANQALVHMGNCVEKARLHLEQTETEYTTARAKHAELHAKIAPLFQRLP